MSFTGGITNRWRDKNRQSSGSFLNRAKTAAPDSDPDEDLRKLFEGVVLNAFNSEAFREAIASQINPALSKQQEKLNQLKTANLNLESIFQLQIENLTEKLEPALSHVASLKNANYEDDFSSLFHGQHVFLERLDAIDQRFETLVIPQYDDQIGKLLVGQEQVSENIQKHVDRRIDALDIPQYDDHFAQITTGQDELSKSLEQKVEQRMEALETQLQVIEDSVRSHHNELQESELRSALRFGELSNELQDRNTMLGNRLTETERGIGKKMDAQQRRVVGVCEEVRNVCNTTQDRLSSLESMQAEFGDQLTSNEETCKKTKSISEGVATKVDKLDRGIRHDIDGLRETVAALDTTPIENLPRRLDDVDRATTEIRKELENQRSLAAVDSKLLSKSISRMDSLASNIANMAQVLDSVDEKVSDETDHNLHIEKLDSLDSKIGWINTSVEKVHKRVGSMDISMLPDHTKHLADIVATVVAIEQKAGNLDKSATAHETGLSDAKKLVADIQISQKRGFEELSTVHTSTLDELRTNISELQSHLDSEFDSQTKKLSNISYDILQLPNSNSIEEISETVMDTKSLVKASTNSVMDLQKETANSVLSIQPVLESFRGIMQHANSAIESISSDARNIISKTEAGNSSLLDMERKISSIGGGVVALISETKDLSSKVDDGNSILKDLRALDKTSEIVNFLGNAKDSHMKHASGLQSLNDILVANGASNETRHDASILEFKEGMTQLLSNFDGSHTSHTRDIASIAESNKSHANELKAIEERLSQQLAKTEDQIFESKNSIREMRNNVLASIADNDVSHREKHETTAEELKKILASIETAVSDTNHNISNTKTSVEHILPSLEKSATSNSELLSSLASANSSLEQQILGFETRIRDYLGTLGTVVSKSQSTISETKTSVASIFPLLEASKIAHAEHQGNLKRIIEIGNNHDTALDNIQESSTDISGLLMHALTVAENNSSSLAALSDSVARREDLSSANATLQSITTSIEHQKTVLDQLSTATAVQELKDVTQSTQDILNSHTITLSEIMNADMGDKLISASRDIMNAVEGVAEHVDTIDGAYSTSFEQLKDDFSESHSVLASHTVILSQLVRSAVNTDILSLSRDIKEVVDSVAEKHDASDAATVESLGGLKNQISVSHNILEKQSATLDELSSSTATTDTLAISKEISKTVTDVAEKICSVNTRARDDYISVKAMLEGNKSVIGHVYDEVKDHKTLLQNASSKSEVLNITSELESFKEELSGGNLMSHVTELIDSVKDLKSSSQQEEIIRISASVESVVRESANSLSNVQSQIESVQESQTKSLAKLEDIADENKTLNSAAQQVTIDIGSRLESSDEALQSSIKQLQSVVKSEHGDTRLKLRESIKTAIHELSQNHASSLKSTHEAVLSLDSKYDSNDKAIVTAIQDVKSTIETEHAAMKSTLTTVSTELSEKISSNIADSISGLRDSTERMHAEIADIKTVTNTIQTSSDSLAENLSNTEANLISVSEVNSSKVDSSNNELKENLKQVQADFTTLITNGDTKTDAAVAKLQEALNAFNAENKAGIESCSSFIVESYKSTKGDLKEGLASVQDTLNSLRENVDSVHKINVSSSEQVTSISQAIGALDQSVTMQNTHIQSSLDVIDSRTDSAHEMIVEQGKISVKSEAALLNINEKVINTSDSMRTLLDEKIPELTSDIKALDTSEELRNLTDLAEDKVKELSRFSSIVTDAVASAQDTILQELTELSNVGLIVRETKELVNGNIKEVSNLNETFVDTNSKSHATILQKLSAMDLSLAVAELKTDAQAAKNELTKTNDQLLKNTSHISDTVTQEVSSLRDFFRDSDMAATKSAHENTKLLTSVDEFMRQIPDKTESVLSREISGLDSTMKTFEAEVKDSRAEMEKMVAGFGKTLEVIRTTTATTEKDISATSKTADETLNIMKDFRASNTSTLTTHTTLLSHIQETIESNPTKIGTTLSQKMTTLEKTLRDVIATTGQDTIEAVKVTQTLLSEAKQHIGYSVLDGTANLTLALETMDSKIGNLSDIATSNARKCLSFLNLLIVCKSQ
jgi:hypothetical protein